VSPARAVVVARREGQGSVVFAAIELGSLETLTAGDALPEGASVIVLDSNGDVVTRAPASSHVPPGLAPLARRMEGTTQELTARGGERRLYSVQQIAGAGGGGLSVSVGLPHGTAYGAADRTVWRTLAAIALVALLALAAAVWVSERLVLRPLGGLLGATRRLATGERGVRSEVIAPRGELRELAESFDAMAAALDRRASEAERSMRERQRLLGELVTAEEDERNRLAVDIHDDSVQAISAALLRMEMLEARLEDPEHRRSLVVAIESVRAAITRLRHLVFELTPPAIARGGLAHALGLYLAQVGSSWGAEAELVDRLHDEPSPSLGGLVYRIAVEATGNAARHARASHITVALEQRDGGVHVVVTDDGIGFDVAAVLETPVPGHVGLRSMRDRAGSAGGSWHVDSEPGRGTILEFWIPDLGAGTPNGRD
jgi:signal transduction histidine kinase